MPDIDIPILNTTELPGPVQPNESFLMILADNTTGIMSKIPLLGLKNILNTDNDLHIDKAIGTNLFDKKLVRKGWAIAYNTGVQYMAAGFNVGKVYVNPNTDYTIAATQQIAFFKSDGTYINGLANAGVGGVITTPSEAAYFLINVGDAYIDVQNINQGTVQLPYEAFKNTNPDLYVDVDNVVDLPAITSFNKVISNNLYDIDNPYAVGYYVDYLSGTLSPIPGLGNVYKISVDPSTQYTIRNPQQLAFFTSGNTYISGLSNIVDGPVTITTPSGAAYFLLTVLTAAQDTQQVNKGTKVLSFDKYVQGNDDVGIASVNVTGDFTGKLKNVITVSKTGSKYSTINDALSSFSDDAADNTYCIIVMPGTYIESVNTAGRYVSLVGIDRERTVIKTYTNDYFHPPIDATGNNYFYNITFHADDDGVTTPPGGAGGNPAYALHFDAATRFEGMGVRAQGLALFSNCKFISMHQCAAGIGLWTNQDLRFERCEFVTYSTANATSFRAHNYSDAGATGQRLNCIDCIMRTAGTPTGDNFAIALQDPNNAVGPGDNTDTVFQFVRCLSYTQAGGQDESLYTHAPVVPGAIAGKILLGVGSFGNSSDELNK